jgi:uncharacterized protein (DUF1501 family)
MSCNPIPGPPGPPMPWHQPPPGPSPGTGPEPVEGHEPAKSPAITKSEQLKTTVSPVTRRRFLTFCGVVGAAGIAAGATQVHWSDLVSAAAKTPLDPADGVLVIITLYGGNDGLNTVIPAGDAAYQSARGELAYAASDVLDLGEGLGLNPGMKGLHELWGNKELAIVRGVGYPYPDRSHFRSMAIWQSASPQSAVSTGWLGRWLDATTTNPLIALSVDSLVPPMLAGEKLAAASFPIGGLRMPKNVLDRAVALLGKPSSDDDVWRARAARSFADLQAAVGTFGPAQNRQPSATPTTDPDDQENQGASAGGQGQLAAQLDLVATLIEMGVPTRVYSVSLGGFDTHSDERATQQRLLAELDAALTGFHRRLAAGERGRQVVTMIYSEFGRRVLANASDGTDHGTAGPVFLLGRGVRGGFFGAEPSLTDLDDGDLKAGTDFRSIYATLLDHVLGADPTRILDGYGDQVDRLIA